MPGSSSPTLHVWPPSLFCRYAQHQPISISSSTSTDGSSFGIHHINWPLQQGKAALSIGAGVGRTDTQTPSIQDYINEINPGVVLKTMSECSQNWLAGVGRQRGPLAITRHRGMRKTPWPDDEYHWYELSAHTHFWMHPLSALDATFIYQYWQLTQHTL